MTLKLALTNKQNGIALLSTLILITALVLTLGNIFYRHQIDVARLSKMLHSDQAMLMALSVESWAGQLLSDAQDNREYDNLEERWSIAVPILPIDGGFIRGCIVDLQSKININNFSNYDNNSWLKEFDNGGNGLAKSWLSLLTQQDLPASEALAVSIIDWLDEDNTPFNTMGAEQINYTAARSSVIVANALLSEPSELSVIQGYNLGMFQRLEPYITALPHPSSININTASEEVLLAIGGLYATVFADFTLNNKPFARLDDFQRQLSNYLNLSLIETSTLWPESLIGVNSDYFLLNLEVSLGDARIEVHSIMDRYQRNEPVIISRTISVIPEILPSTLNAEEEDSSAAVFCEATTSINS